MTTHRDITCKTLYTLDKGGKRLRLVNSIINRLINYQDVELVHLETGILMVEEEKKPTRPDFVRQHEYNSCRSY